MSSLFPCVLGKSEETAVKKQDFICAILIRNLDFEGMSHETVTEVFKHCGGILGVRLRHGKYTLIFFKSKEHAKLALEMNGKVVSRLALTASSKGIFPKFGKIQTDSPGVAQLRLTW